MGRQKEISDRLEYQREWQRTYTETNREAVNTRSAEYYQKNRDRILEKARAKRGSTRPRGRPRLEVECA
jgi:hypothetical protein